MKLRVRDGLVLVILVAAAPLIVANFATVLALSHSERVAAEERTSLEAKAVSQFLISSIDESRRALELVARDSSVDWERSPSILAALAKYRGYFPYSNGIYAFDIHGNQVVGPGEKSVNITDRQWFSSALDEHDFVIGQFIQSRITGIPALPMAHEVQAAGKPVAVVGMSINLQWMVDNLRENHRFHDGMITLIDPDGTVQVRFPTPDGYTGKRLTGDPLVKAALGKSARTAILPGLDNVLRVYSIEPLVLGSRVFGTLTVGIPVGIIHAASENAQLWGWIAVLVLVWTIVATLFGFRFLVLAPLKTLGDHSALLARGDFAQRLTTRGFAREFRQLGDSVNLMAESLATRDQELTMYRQGLEKQVAERTAELQRSNAELQQFAYVASHDLQEPLRMVASFTQLLDTKYRDQLDDAGREYIRYAVDGAQRMKRLINDLLEFSRVDSRPQLNEAVDSLAVVQDVQRAFAILLNEKQGSLTISGDLPAVWADSGQLFRVFQNLIGNGLKFNRNVHPHVEVAATRPSPGWAEFSVTDNGIGIDPEFADQVFVIFRRLHGREQFEGTGIGLAVCKRIIEKSGGKIRLDTTYTGGSRFVFTLPLAPGGS